MRIKTHRFGDIDIPEGKIISMARPILGFESMSSFCLIENDDIVGFPVHPM